MPGDTLHINNKAKAQNTFDAIVIGSGISGGWAAKELCEKGLKNPGIGKGARCKAHQRLSHYHQKPLGI